MIRVRRGRPAAPLEPLLGGFADAWAYGSADDGLPARDRRRAARRRRLSLTCTSLSTELASVLARAGIKVRLVAVLTRDALNENDNGHTLVEIRDPEGWRVYDPSFRTFFRRGGRRLSLAEWCDAVRDGDYEIEVVRASTDPLGEFTHGADALRERMEALVASEELRRRWYERVAGVPLVLVGESFVFSADDPDAARVDAYSSWYRSIPPSHFHALWADGESSDGD